MGVTAAMTGDAGAAGTAERGGSGRGGAIGVASVGAGRGAAGAATAAALGEADGAPAFDFHWADNIQGFGDVSELGLHGDSAPNRRWTAGTRK